ncbi:isochorismatase family protein [Kosakonia radicincitans]|uniref:Nicotinamidase-related amidase n=1 Tax=Kosakonia radicincitans TaxID=283686 RepID=A0AAX2EU02_9ENTR|nr:isochorismatase family protein [Kosakonia radicincitans]MDP9567674.1 nicotinamidase-related amidase [Kosakonia oryzae]QEM89248.1 isochorismatase family protein [Kosakonia radicincitans]SFE96787.1 Nicotinamidase-related amidase [Kosakonia radicincitans]SFR18805.1 Nicotinamidase-related amidase [Kosakonia radicincitans]SFT82390.1 Nicotinamidase-related amidase [Kosakonia radicincitans]
MSRTALINIDTQQSFFHREYWQEKDFPAFQQAISALISGCEARGIPVVDIFHVADSGPFSLESGFVAPMPFLTHQPAVTFYKHVHNAFTDTGLDHWLRARDINHLIICGIRTEQCCETTARVASDLGYRVTFASEATLTFPMTHKGITLDCDALRHRTETVLEGRFATIQTVHEILER